MFGLLTKQGGAILAILESPLWPSQAIHHLEESEITASKVSATTQPTTIIESSKPAADSQREPTTKPRHVDPEGAGTDMSASIPGASSSWCPAAGTGCPSCLSCCFCAVAARAPLPDQTSKLAIRLMHVMWCEIVCTASNSVYAVAARALCSNLLYTGCGAAPSIPHRFIAALLFSLASTPAGAGSKLFGTVSKLFTWYVCMCACMRTSARTPEKHCKRTNLHCPISPRVSLLLKC